ncbi:hypothetical protein Val02_62890 [Virgisporangium aliadipatigenens]|uniref:Uncharacterized protein n=1 Tax=Virgisporangium aliadipatigenens TaxID=741659 RepID=A0A8J3YTD0_9ACTN|nr:hypothetical protein [Virgisporangium aliadipatigenens]GIJ49403.1 hypothetical protein Val02_62890 [Virgisporangium aliadipatigenens]
MSTADEIMHALQQTGTGVGQGIAAANGAKGKTEQAIAQATALGSRDKIAEYNALKAAIEEAITALNGGQEKVVQALNRARAAAG